MRARLSILAGALPAEMSLCKRWRSSSLSSTRYFFTLALLLGRGDQQDRAGYFRDQITVDRGLGKLEKSGEAREVRGRHAEHFLALAENAEAEFWGQGEAVWPERIEAEHDNLRGALSWTLERGETETSLRLAGALSWFLGGE